MLTVAFLTNRKEPRIQWFFDSLHNECLGDYTEMKIVVIDFYADDPGRRESFSDIAHCPITHSTPKPTVWQGKHKLTKINYFAASNTRNTALCLAPDGYIAYVDDLSVLLPGWLTRVRAAMSGKYIVFGTFQKVFDLKVANGSVVSYKPQPDCLDPHGRTYTPGMDSRLATIHINQPIPAPGSALYGCSLALPVESLLAINGWDEDCDGMGSEDTICGIMLSYHHHRFLIDPGMRTYESEEDHHVEQSFKRTAKERHQHDIKDKAHRMLDMAIHGNRHVAPNYFGSGGIRALRANILAGGEFPIVQCPENDWFDNQLLREMS